jgi:AcrR family transcriptional regulator
MAERSTGNQVRPGKTRRREPSQDRSLETVRTLLDATAQVLTEVGVEKTSTNKIAKRADVAVGSIYQYFPNKEALIGALVEDRMRTLGALARARMAALESDTFADAADAMVRAVVEFLSDEPGIVPVLMSHAILASGDGVAGQLKADAETLGRGFLEQLDDRTVPDLDVAVYISTNVAGLFGALLAGPDVDDEFRERAITEVVRMLSSWMTGTASPDGRQTGA